MVFSLRTVPVEEGDVWIFFASHELHATVPRQRLKHTPKPNEKNPTVKSLQGTIEGPKPRIVFGFGWSGTYIC